MSANWIIFYFFRIQKLILFKTLSPTCACLDGLCLTECECDGISNLPGFTILSYRVHVIIGIDRRRGVDRLIFGLSRRSISMRIIDCHTNSIAWLRSRPCKFSWAGSATGYANSLEKKGTTDICDCSTRLETHYDLWIMIAAGIFFFSPDFQTYNACVFLSIKKLFEQVLWITNSYMFEIKLFFYLRFYIFLFLRVVLL